MSLCSKFIRETVYQILLESPQFYKSRHYKKHFGLFFWTHCIHCGCEREERRAASLCSNLMALSPSVLCERVCMAQTSYRDLYGPTYSYLLDCSTKHEGQHAEKNKKLSYHRYSTRRRALGLRFSRSFMRWFWYQSKAHNYANSYQCLTGTYIVSRIVVIVQCWSNYRFEWSVSI